MATDELILARSLGVTFSRDSRGNVEQAERLYTPYIIHAGGAEVACVFRDHVLSDLIGFTYSGWSADAAADDFVRRLSEAGRRYTERTGDGRGVIPIILDGENAWEHFDGGGRPFLRAMYSRLSNHPDLRTVTMAEACANAKQELTTIFPGSWIDGNFYIWIGHHDDQQAWSQLADARRALDAPTSVEGSRFERAHEEVLIAEGSDWFWWYGDDHSSAHDLEFDDLFRRHLQNVYRLLDRPVPDELFVSNISGGVAAPAQTVPSAWLSPTLDGEETSYFEWLGAGTLEVRDLSGAMHRSGRRPPLLTRVQFGFDREHLYVRLDASRRVADLLAEGCELALKFLRPDGLRFAIRQVMGRASCQFWHRRPEAPHWVERGAAGARAAIESIAELSLPFADLGVRAGQPLAFFISACDPNGVEVERHPEHRPIELLVPDEQFEARNWSA
jgi:hypothetical protein